jgi:hypothetical protein
VGAPRPGVSAGRAWIASYQDVGWTIQEILGAGLEAVLEKHKLPGYAIRAARALIGCRTAALGGHTKRCPAGHVQGIWYNSCRHRMCPQCSWGKIEAWLAAKRELLLPCDHYHVIFTVPWQFRRFWQWNPRVFGELLFRVSADTLRTLLGEERRLGAARPGWIAALHTWGRTLVVHPHVHCLVVGGGLAADGTWQAVSNGYLLPYRQVRHVFRQRFCAALEALLRSGELELPGDLSLPEALRIVAKARRRKWNVRLEAPYRHGEGVAVYLARYLKGGPIKNRRLAGFDGQEVAFRYGDFREADAAGKPKTKVMRLSVAEFLERLLQHVPPPGLKMVRSYGLYAPRCRDELEQARAAIDPSPEWTEARRRIDRRHPATPTHQPRCPVCGRALIVLGRESATGIPPPAPALEGVSP